MMWVSTLACFFDYAIEINDMRRLSGVRAAKLKASWYLNNGVVRNSIKSKLK